MASKIVEIRKILTLKLRMPGQFVILYLSGVLSQQSPLPTLFSVSCWLTTPFGASVQAGLSMVPLYHVLFLFLLCLLPGLPSPSEHDTVSD